MTYDSKDKVLFSADGFGKFGALDVEEDWACEARRYYFNIVGKYGAESVDVAKSIGADSVALALVPSGWTAMQPPRRESDAAMSVRTAVFLKFLIINSFSRV